MWWVNRKPNSFSDKVAVYGIRFKPDPKLQFEDLYQSDATCSRYAVVGCSAEMFEETTCPAKEDHRFADVTLNGYRSLRRQALNGQWELFDFRQTLFREDARSKRTP